MFFTSKLIEALTKDHLKIREEINILKNTSLTLRERKIAFNLLVPILTSHTKREKKVVYSFMKASNKADLKAMAFEGEEEHIIVDRILGEISDNRMYTEEWSAKTKVLSVLVKHHLDEEENTVFPHLKGVLDKETDLELFTRYTTVGKKKSYTLGHDAIVFGLDDVSDLHHSK